MLIHSTTDTTCLYFKSVKTIGILCKETITTGWLQEGRDGGFSYFLGCFVLLSLRMPIIIISLTLFFFSGLNSHVLVRLETSEAKTFASHVSLLRVVVVGATPSLKYHGFLLIFALLFCTVLFFLKPS
eukprot:g64670.t1